MFILSLFGIKLSAIWGAAGVAGIAVAFAAQTSVSNIISGIFVIAEKTLKIGDLINVAGETGIVDTIGLLSVKVHTLDNQMIRIPNSTIINSTLRNTSFFDKRRLDVKVSVSYDTDMETALNVLAKAPKYCKDTLKDPEPLVWFDGFGDSGINMTLAVWFKKENFLAAKNETFIAIKRVYDEAGIEIPYNKLDVKVYDSENQFIAGAARKIKAKTQPKTKKIDKRIRGKSKATKNLIESESAKEYDPDDEH
jgi:small-conductance mechanosensitive channel